MKIVLGEKSSKRRLMKVVLGCLLNQRVQCMVKLKKNFFIRIQHRQLYSKHRNQDSKISTIKPQKKKELIPIPVTRSKKYFTL